MRKIIAIGGGEIGRIGVKNETLGIDREIIKLSGKTNPKLLFIPTASGDASGYVESVQKYFGKKLGCKVDSLELILKKYTKKELEDKILKTDIVYVGGGNTLKMMKVWRKLGVDSLLEKAMKKGIVLSGLSAGSICWFRYGNSDSARFGKNKEASMMRVKGLDMIPALHCPHYDVENGREESLKEMMKRNKGVAIAIDNCSAIEIVGDQYRILKTKKTANTYKVYWKSGKYFKELIPAKKNMHSLSELLK
ncbi:MAG: type 1 glutamine amidotransferase-like domain-containing protein [Candidatus Moranbacteria bacterium]|nr:type 1 glutamine amidotransferase-like domain-containing protein [Candidatus Moranbacteria bacterium]